jgi:putative N6-adenine-specific DNA methylase
MSGATSYRLFLGVTPGLEAPLAAEVEALTGGAPKRLEGGVEVRAPREVLLRLAHDVRQAESLRLRIGRFEARRFDQLEAGARRLPWAAYLPRGSAPVVKATCQRSALYHSDAVAERVSRAIAERLGAPDPASPPAAATIHVRMHEDVAELSLDVAVERMHRRGWREHSSAAPLRESLAASLLALADWRPDEPLWDPFCGAGTIPLEAAAQRAGHPARSGPFAFEAWPSHDAAAYGSWLAGRASHAAGAPHGAALDAPPIGGSDRSPKAVDAALHNRARSGLGDTVRFEVFDVRDGATPPWSDDALLVSNLPYGKRITDAVAEGCLRALTQRQRSRQGRAVVLSGARWLRPALEAGWRPLATFSNRGLPVVALAWGAPPSAAR